MRVFYCGKIMFKNVLKYPIMIYYLCMLWLLLTVNTKNKMHWGRSNPRTYSLHALNVHNVPNNVLKEWKECEIRTNQHTHKQERENGYGDLFIDLFADSLMYIFQIYYIRFFVNSTPEIVSCFVDALLSLDSVFIEKNLLTQ